MIRRKSILRGRAQDFDSGEVNPLESIPNIADVMLVFAVALMIALIANWGVRISDITQIDESSLQALNTDVSATEVVEAASSNQYEEIGTVYMDVDTGNMYVLKE